MLIFQLQKRREDEEDGNASPIGMRIRRAKFSSINPKEDDELVAEAKLWAQKKLAKEKRLSEFIGTLAPGAQNAIFAASFAWGFENAMRHVKNAMRLEEVKNAADSEERSKALIENIQSQLAHQPEKSKQFTRFAWSYYNEDLKDVQALSSGSQTMGERHPHEEKEREEIRIGAMAIPISPSEAVALSVFENSQKPSIAYCANAMQEMEEIQKKAVIEEKKRIFASLVAGGHIREAAVAETKKDALEIAIKRRDELVEEYAKAERKLAKAIEEISRLSISDHKGIARSCARLPEDLRALAGLDGKFSSKALLRKQLVKWLSSCRKGKKSLLRLNPGRLLKLVSLSSLLKKG